MKYFLNKTTNEIHGFDDDISVGGEIFELIGNNPPPQQFATIKLDALSAINKIRDERIYAGVEYPASSGQVFETDEKSQLNIAGAVTMALLAAQAGEPFEQPWILKNNSTTLLSGPLMMGLGQAVGVHVGTHTVQARGYKNQINDATTAAEIAALIAAYEAL